MQYSQNGKCETSISLVPGRNTPNTKKDSPHFHYWKLKIKNKKNHQIQSLYCGHDSCKDFLKNQAPHLYLVPNETIIPKFPKHKTAHHTFSSSRENPLPALTFILYFRVCPWTIGRSGPDVGRGKIFTAFFCLAGDGITDMSRKCKHSISKLDNETESLWPTN